MSTMQSGSNGWSRSPSRTGNRSPMPRTRMAISGSLCGMRSTICGPHSRETGLSRGPGSAKHPGVRSSTGTWNSSARMAASACAPAPTGRSSTRLQAGRSAFRPRWWRRSSTRSNTGAMTRPILYDYFPSSAAYRVRIALNLKGVDYESRQVDLRDDEQKGGDYRALNPQGLVPMLEIDALRLVQSLAIIGYLDMRFPNQPLIPAAAAERAHVVAMAMTVACDIQPLNNLPVLKYLKNELGHSQDEIDAWYAHWLNEGLPALEAMAAPKAGKFLFGDAPTGADVCLV